jgi:trimethylamine--corrinoid protein Co-methyltransferase
MSETQTSERRSRRGGGRDARRQMRTSRGAATSAPFITRQIAPVDILSEEATEIIEYNA